MLDIEAILATAPSVTAPPATVPPATARGHVLLGRSREDRPIHGFVLGQGPLRVSLIAGCHADEPVGPAMLERLVAWLATRPTAHPALQTFTWHLVPHANPDGAERNRPWIEHTVAVPWATDRRDGERKGYDLRRYLRQALREAPGDDVEFGFPRDAEDRAARPENQAVARFLRAAAPLHLHASFHGMAFAAGPWFLLEPAWIDRTGAMRDRVRLAVGKLGYTLHDIDRRGDKGFERIDEGFTTRPNANAMIAHFEARGDRETASHFRPNSMDFVRQLGGDPLTLVSEMPLFLAPAALYRETPIRPAALAALQATASSTESGDDSGAAFDRQAEQMGVRPMPIADQMRLQLTYLAEALETLRGTAPD